MLELGKYNENELSTVRFLLQVMEMLGFKCRSSLDVLSITRELEVFQEIHLFSFAKSPNPFCKLAKTKKNSPCFLQGYDFF